MQIINDWNGKVTNWNASLRIKLAIQSRQKQFQVIVTEIAVLNQLAANGID